MRKRGKRLIAVGLGAVAVTATTQGSAAADEDNYITASSARTPNCSNGGYAEFHDLSERMYVNDICPDGRDVRVRWKYQYKTGEWSPWYDIHHTDGALAGEKKYELDQPRDNDGNLPDDRGFLFQVGQEIDGKFKSGTWGNEVFFTT